MSKLVKTIYILGSTVIGLAMLLAVFAGLVATGSVESRQNKLIFASADYDEVYSGEPVTCEEWSLISGNLKAGHTAVVTVLGSQTVVGQSENTISASIVDENGADVTGDYEIEYSFGMLTVLKRALTIRASSAQKVYDGKELTSSAYEITDGSVARAHFLDVSTAGSIINAGTCENEITAHIFDVKDKDVTANYDISYISGTLEITKREIVVRSGDLEKEYDGNSAFCSDWSVTVGELVEGQSVITSAFSEMTDVGEYENKFLATISDGNGNDKTNNYEIQKDFGTITVTKKPIDLATAGGEKIYDGMPLTAEDIYLDESALCEGHTAEYRTEGSLTDKGSAENGYVLTIYDAEGKDVTSNYEPTETLGTLVVYARQLTITSLGDEKTYDGAPLNKYEAEFTLYAAEQGLLPEHSPDITYRGEITDVGSVENEFDVEIIGSDGTPVTGNYDIEKVFGELEVTERSVRFVTGSGGEIYDGNEFTVSECEEGVFELYEAGYYSEENGLLTGHRYVADNFVGVTDYTPVPVDNECEVKIYDEFGREVSSNYDISIVFGKLTIYKRPIRVVTGSSSKIYDGEPLTDDNYYIDGEVAVGDELNVEVDGEITEVGTTDNTFTAYVTNPIRGGVTENYDIIAELGTLQVYMAKLTVTSETDEKTYDGTPLDGNTVNGDGYYYSGTIMDGHRLSVSVYGSITDAGSCPNEFDYAVYDAYDNDVTHMYLIEKSVGVLTVKRRKITLRSGTKATEYSGKALSSVGETLTVAAGSLAFGNYAVAEYENSITDVGTVANSFTARIYDFDEIDVTSNYEIDYLYGTLTVEKRKLSVSTPDCTKTYDGTALLYDNDSAFYTLNAASNLAAGERIEATFMPTPFVNVGSGLNECAVYVYSDTRNRYTTDNYDITYEFGSATITPKDVYVKTKDYSKVYDGNAVSANDCLLNGFIASGDGDVISGHHVVATFKGSVYSNVGQYVNYVDISVKDYYDNVVTENYNITVVYGSITITKKHITVSTFNYEKVYDGVPVLPEECEANGYEITGEIADGQYVSLSFKGSVKADAGTYENRVDVTVSDAFDNLVTDNYSITYEYASLTISKRNLTVETASKVKVYDGSYLYYPTLESVSNLADGDVFTLTDTLPSKKYAGVYDNKIKAYTIVNGSTGESREASYIINIVCGHLTILQKSLTIHTASAEKIYDGEPLTAPEPFSYSALAEGDVMDATVTGTITERGRAANGVEFTVFDEAGLDVTSCYSVTLDLGQLVVKSDESDEPTGGGYSQSEEPFLFVTSEKSGPIYLKERSLMNYKGTTWSTAKSYTGVVEYEDGEIASPFYTTYYAALGEPFEVEIEALDNVYRVPYYSKAIDGAASDIKAVGTANDAYTETCVLPDYLLSLPEYLSDAELAYRAYVYATYLTVDNEKLYTVNGVTATAYSFLNEIIATNDLKKATLSQSISAIRDYLNSLCSYDIEYEEKTHLDETDNHILHFLLDDDCHLGVCRHFAAAGTLLLRVMGYPARYTVGVMINAVAGERVGAKDGHAWCEVYRDGVGFIIAEFTPGDGTGGGGGGGAVDNSLPLSMNAFYVPYDESKEFLIAFTEEDGILDGFDLLAKKGFTYTLTVGGQYDAPGINPCSVVDFVIKDGNGAVATDSFDYDISEAVAYVYLYEVVITSASAEKPYDGEYLTAHELSYKTYSAKGELLAENALIEAGHDLITEFYGKQLAISSSPNYVSAYVSCGGEDMTDIYKITYQYGDLNVTKIALNVSAPYLIVTKNESTKIATITYNGIEENVSFAAAEGDYTTSVKVEGDTLTVRIGNVTVRTFEHAYTATGELFGSHELSVSLVCTPNVGKKTTCNLIVRVKDGDTDVTDTFYSVTRTVGQIHIKK